MGSPTGVNARLAAAIAERDEAREQLADVRERAEFYEGDRNAHRAMAEGYRTTIAAVMDVIARYEDEGLNAVTAFGEVLALFSNDNREEPS